MQRSFKVRNFVGGLIGGTAGILAFGSTGFWPGLFALVVCASVGFVLGFYGRDLPAHLHASWQTAKPIVARRREASITRLRELGAGLHRDRLWLYLWVLTALWWLGWPLGDWNWVSYEASPPAWAILCASALFLGMVGVVVFMGGKALQTLLGYDEPPGAEEIYEAAAVFVLAFMFALVLGPPIIAYILIRNAVRAIVRFVDDLRNDKELRVKIALWGGHILFVALNLFFALFVADVLYLGHPLTYWEVVVCGAFAFAAFLVPMTVFIQWDFEIVLPPLQEEADDPLALIMQARQAHEDRTLSRRQAVLARLGLARYALYIAIRLFAIQFYAVPFVLSLFTIVVLSLLYWVGAMLPVTTMMVFLRTLPRLNSGRHWAGLIVTIATTLATALVFRDTLAGRTLLVVALINGLTCGALSVALIHVAHTLPATFPWARMLKQDGIRALLDPGLDRLLKPILRIGSFLSRPIDRLAGDPGMGI